MQLSCCILPGQDPRDSYSKECQDCLGHLSLDNAAIMVLCDGHGKEGRTVADFSLKFMLAYFTCHAKAFERDTPSMLVQMFEECDQELRKTKDIDASLSGCTAIAAVLTETCLHVGSVGDSRAVLAKVPKVGEELPDITIMKESKFRRRVVPRRLLNPVQLTVDQKPNSDAELERIQRAGGVVKRIRNANGESSGPYRVWKAHSRVPGLALSRSIGDFIASEIGVIATPIVKRFPIELASDLFFVLGSDGLWDVMRNLEVIDFIEFHRSTSAKEVAQVRGPVMFTNTSIAQLVCEEARMRWMELVQERDLVIDDISCLIVEFNLQGPSTHKRLQAS